MRQHFGDAVRYTWRRPAMRWCFLIAALYMFCGGAVWQIAEPISRHLLHATGGRYGALLAAFGGGAVMSALLTLRFGDSVRASRTVLGALAGVIVAELLIVLAPSYGVGMAGFVVFGGAHVLVIVTVMTVMHGVVHEEYRGRAAAILVMALNGALPVGALVLGLAASAVGLRPAIVGAGVLLVVVSGVVVALTGGLAGLDDRSVPRTKSQPEATAPLGGGEPLAYGAPGQRAGDRRAREGAVRGGSLAPGIEAGRAADTA